MVAVKEVVTKQGKLKMPFRFEGSFLEDYPNTGTFKHYLNVEDAITNQNHIVESSLTIGVESMIDE